MIASKGRIACSMLLCALVGFIGCSNDSASHKTALGDPDKIDVLIVHNGKKFDRESFFGIFKCDDINYSEYLLKDESEVFEDISAWNYDVILLYNMTQKISPKRQENFVRLLKEKGIGLVVLHHAQAAFQSWREYHYIIGTAYIYFDVEIDGKLWPHGKVHKGVRIPISVVDDRHPITRGMKDFEIIDETYMGRWWAEDNHVLLTTSHPENDEPIAWTRKYGKSRVFNIQLGHGIEAHNCPEFRELLVRGVRWTVGIQGGSGTDSGASKQPAGGAGEAGGGSTDTVEDADGNVYHTVKIGNQVWTVENLRTTKYNDGTPIPHVADTEQWKSISTPAYCYYENNSEHGKKYGVLYNWYAASSGKIAPMGWRVPTREEQLALRDYLIANGYNYDGTTEGNKVAKSMAAKTDWIYKTRDEGENPVSIEGLAGKNPETNNKSGFSALPAGCRWCDGSFHAIGTSQYWWSATPYNDVNGYMSSVHTWFAKYGDNNHKKRSGFSIRLIRDENNKGSKAATMIPESFGDPNKIDVLVVTGGLGIDRDQFFALFNGRDEFRFVEYPLKDESEVFEDISDWKYDVLMLYNATQEISQKRRDNFVSLLKDKGIGLVVVHHAQAAFQNWLEFHKINGSAFIYYDVQIDGKLWPHSKCKGGMDIPVTICDKQHPITRGLTDFRVLDETYKGRWWAEDNHVLLTTDHPGNDKPIAWTRQYGKSRVFNIQLGHDYHTYEVPQYRDLIIRGICWTDGTQEGPGAGASVGESAETVKDADGNVYHTVKIGNQIWTVENLRTTRYNDGTPIPQVTDAAGWKGLASPGFCYFNNDPENGKKYGALYNWWAACSDKIAPKGWRVPTHEDQAELCDYLIANGYNCDGTKDGDKTGNKLAKSMTAKTDWEHHPTPETAGHDLTTNNSTGFSALPAGSRWNDGSFHSIGHSVYWWSTTPGNGEDAHMSSIHSRFAKYGFNQHHKRSGFCIRLVREASEQAAQSAPGSQSSSVISGTVKNVSGARLAGARVKLENANKSTITDSKGNFSFDQPVITANAEGDVQEVLTVIKDGYLDYQIHVTDSGASAMTIEMIACAGTVTDVDGNVYQTVKIGDFVWTTSNLKTTKFNDGTPIPCVTEATDWQSLSSPAWCYNENIEENGKNGLLYNWWAASHEKIAPKGWHVPTIEEQRAFREYLVHNGYNFDGTKYPDWDGSYGHEKDKENKLGKPLSGRIGWKYRIKDKAGYEWERDWLICERPELNNKTGFNCLPNGTRWHDGSFHNLTESCYMWSRTSHENDRDGWLISVHTWSRYLGDNAHQKRTGFGIRLLKDKD